MGSAGTGEVSQDILRSLFGQDLLSIGEAELSAPGEEPKIKDEMDEMLLYFLY